MADLFFLFLFQYVLVLPVAFKTKSVRRFLLAGLASFFGVVLPLLVFLLSAILVPQSKEECRHGWLDCFIQGKLALTLFALWATAALYAVDVLRVENRTRPWIVLGYLFGAIISIACSIFLLTYLPMPMHWEDLGAGMMILAIPLYVAIWYSVRAVQLIRAARLGLGTYLIYQLVSAPFWVLSYFWCKNTYAALPETGGCFIVTAASRGHERFTGPHAEILRHGRRLRANQQLLTFWELESRWKIRSPRSHTAFRRVYNQVGPIIAARIKSPWLADATCLALKPLEFTARWINRRY